MDKTHATDMVYIYIIITMYIGLQMGEVKV